MSKFITALVVGAALLVATQASSEGARRRYRSAPVYQQVVVPTAMPAQAAASSGYRSFSYDPGSSYAPRGMVSGGSPNRDSSRYSAHSAGWKSGVGR